VRFLGRYLSMVPANDGEEVYITSCPYAHLFRDNAVGEALTAHRWSASGNLSLLYPNGLPVALRDAITAVGNGIARAERERLEANHAKQRSA